MARLSDEPFEAETLPEEAAPAHARECGRCELSGQRTRVIWGEGNPDAPIFLLLDNPGAREDRQGNAFVCGTRETLQMGMREAGLPTDAVYVTYLLKCRPIRAYDKPLARESCASHFAAAIAGETAASVIRIRECRGRDAAPLTRGCQRQGAPGELARICRDSRLVYLPSACGAKAPQLDETVRRRSRVSRGTLEEDCRFALLRNPEAGLYPAQPVVLSRQYAPAARIRCRRRRCIFLLLIGILYAPFL
ncbi:uracil-DNA glycosylase family protein [Cohnella sp. CFH 77786]|uniref:uracil-DNA glycosylase family protein n=1 Tax=Cohnella sp. CFH 77786 TaxID=2662265 RepID=UPI00351CD687